VSSSFIKNISFLERSDVLSADRDAIGIILKLLRVRVEG
jgi:hypothetical protein